MQIAVFSDIHDNIWKLSSALEKIQDVDVLICCGDLCAPFVVAQLAEGFFGPIHIIFGNNDGDTFRITQIAGQHDQVILHGEFADANLAKKRIAVTHFPEIAYSLAGSGFYDLVCYGHDHQYRISREGETLLINPGEIMGRFGNSTFAIYDAEKEEAKRVVV